MTKEEIKLIKEQQAQIEKGYKYQIKRLEEDLQTAKGELSTAAEQVDTLSRGKRGSKEPDTALAEWLIGRGNILLRRLKPVAI